eukprot:3982156-Alexandrium_andersonii.AAC.1
MHDAACPSGVQGASTSYSRRRALPHAARQGRRNAAGPVPAGELLAPCRQAAAGPGPRYQSDGCKPRAGR